MPCCAEAWDDDMRVDPSDVTESSGDERSAPGFQFFVFCHVVESQITMLL